MEHNIFSNRQRFIFMIISCKNTVINSQIDKMHLLCSSFIIRHVEQKKWRKNWKKWRQKYSFQGDVCYQMFGERSTRGIHLCITARSNPSVPWWISHGKQYNTFKSYDHNWLTIIPCMYKTKRRHFMWNLGHKKVLIYSHISDY